MTHLRIWLLVGLTIVMAGLVWLLPQEAQRRTQELRQQMAPLKTSQTFQQHLYQEQQKLLARSQHIAKHSKVVLSMQPLAEVASSDRWNWKERYAHRQALKGLEQHLASFRKVVAQRKLYIFSHQQRILLENADIVSSVHQEHPMARLPVVEAAKRGQTLWGFWSEADQTYLIASTPIWGKADNTPESTDSKKTSRSVVGMVLLMQPLSAAMLANWKPHKTTDETAMTADSSQSMVMLFTARHPLFYHTVGSPAQKRSPAPVGSPTQPRSAGTTKLTPAAANPQSLSRLEQAFKHWSARHFAQLTQNAQGGLFVSKSPLQLEQQTFHYAVGQITAPVSNGQVGYILLTPATPTASPLYQSKTLWLGMLAIVFALLLGLWASASWHSEQKQLQAVLADFLVNPESLRSVKQLPGAFAFLFQYLRPIAHRIQQGSSAVPSYEKPMSLAQVASAPATDHVLKPKAPSPLSIVSEVEAKPQNTLETIRALSADGSLVLPQRPKGMTYFHQSAKEDTKKEVSPLDMLLQETNHASSDMKSTPSNLGALSANSSNTPLPRGFTMPSREESSLPKSLYSSDASALASALMNMPEPVGVGAGAGSSANMGVPVAPSALPLAPSSTGSFLRQPHTPGTMAQEAAAPVKPSESLSQSPAVNPNKPKEMSASQLPLVSAPTNPSTATSVRLAPAASGPGHLNLTTELDQVFSMIASPMTPAPPSSLTGTSVQPKATEVPIQEPTPQASQPSSEEEKMRQVFQHYLDVRKSCGEPTNVQWDSFVELLRKQKTAILQQYSCKDVNFYVQEKDGRAALKATPIH